MLKHLIRHKVGLLDTKRIQAVNDFLLSHDMPVVSKGALYIDGEGTATALVAKAGAELFNAGEYDTVVMAGGVRPHEDRKSKSVFPKVVEERFALPEITDTEAEYAAREFKRYADPEKFKLYLEQNRLFAISHGVAASQKIEACLEHFNTAGLVQAVTLPYSVRRLVGTFAKYAPNVDVSAKGVWPFGLTKDNWQEWHIAYGVVMDEADKTGPILNGKKPKYEDKFFTPVDLEEMGERALKAEASL